MTERKGNTSPSPDAPSDERTPKGRKSTARKSELATSILRELILEKSPVKDQNFKDKDVRFEPGVWVSEDELRSTVNARLRQARQTVSRVPIRDAIAKLVAQGVMEVIPKRGTRLRVITEPQLKEIWDHRAAVEEHVLLRLACKTSRDVTAAKATNAEMAAIVARINVSNPTKQDQLEFARLDDRFHADLIKAAGFRRLSDELESLRFVIFYATRHSLGLSRQRMRAIVNEHSVILDAISGGENRTSIPADMNRVRVAYLSHIKHSAIDSLRVSQRLAPLYGDDASPAGSVFSVPDFMPLLLSPDVTKASLDGLLLLRILIESMAASHLARLPGRNLEMLESRHEGMRMIYQQRTSVEMSNAIREQFSALDLGFHMALCTLGGLLFGAEVVTYVWHRVYGLWGNQSHGSKLVCWEDVEAVNQEHENILEQLRRSAGSFENVTNAAKSVEIHLLNSYRRNGYAAEVADIIDTTLRKWIDRLAKPVP